ncbi:hypothetical protein [uncultured Eubacterium sp.]|uniref:hypothetical protein n=1 Tax=uncultured Eubacterium sp. TaxID=165185 RepID=UPI002594E764|nr:hypothetical protein [uncultured Eubacterium sp.]
MKSKIEFAMAACGVLTCFMGASGLNSESDEGFFISLAIAAVGLAVAWLGLLIEKKNKNKKSVSLSTITRSKPMT